MFSFSLFVFWLPYRFVPSFMLLNIWTISCFTFLFYHCWRCYRRPPQFKIDFSILKEHLPNNWYIYWNVCAAEAICGRYLRSCFNQFHIPICFSCFQYSICILLTFYRFFICSPCLLHLYNLIADSRIQMKNLKMKHGVLIAHHDSFIDSKLFFNIKILII